MIIRDAQLEVMSRSAFPRILQRWSVDLRTELPAETCGYTNEQLEHLLTAGANAAMAYGFSDHSFIREYLRLILRTGADENGKPVDASVRGVLENPAMSPIAKMDRLAILVPDPDAAEQDRAALAAAGGA